MTRCRHEKPLEFSAAWRHRVERGDPPLDLSLFFPQRQPLEIEIGHGKGSFLIEAARARADHDFLAIEWSNGRHIFTGERVAKRNLPNVKLLQGDASEILREQLPAQCAVAVHLYFPDPYWKKKHFKRRIITPEFLETLLRVLVPGGHFFMKSDVPERFDSMVQSIAQRPELERIDFDRAYSPYPAVVSNFEQKALVAGRPIGRAAYRRN